MFLYVNKTNISVTVYNLCTNPIDCCTEEVPLEKRICNHKLSFTLIFRVFVSLEMNLRLGQGPLLHEWFVLNPQKLLWEKQNQKHASTATFLHLVAEDADESHFFRWFTQMFWRFIAFLFLFLNSDKLPGRFIFKLCHYFCNLQLLQSWKSQHEGAVKSLETFCEILCPSKLQLSCLKAKSQSMRRQTYV